MSYLSIWYMGKYLGEQTKTRAETKGEIDTPNNTCSTRMQFVYGIINLDILCNIMHVTVP